MPDAKIIIGVPLCNKHFKKIKKEPANSCPYCDMERSLALEPVELREGKIAMGVLGRVVALAGGEVTVDMESLADAPRVMRFRDPRSGKTIFRVVDGDLDPCPRCKGSGKVKTKDPVEERGFDPDGTAYAAYARYSGPVEPCTRCAGTGMVEKGGKDHHFGKL